MQKIIQHILTAPCQLSRKTFWEIDHIFSYSQEVCSFCSHPLNPKPIVFFTFYKLANCLIASQIRIMWTILPPTAENEITFFYPHLCNGNETEQYYLVPPLDTSQTMSMGRRNPTEVSNWICFTTQNLLEYANEIKTNPRSIYSTQFTSFRCHYQLHFFLTVVVVAELLVKSMHFKIKIDKKRKYIRWTTHMMSYLSLLWDHLFIIFHGF